MNGLTNFRSISQNFLNREIRCLASCFPRVDVSNNHKIPPFTAILVTQMNFLILTASSVDIIMRTFDVVHGSTCLSYRVRGQEMHITALRKTYLENQIDQSAQE